LREFIVAVNERKVSQLVFSIRLSIETSKKINFAFCGFVKWLLKATING